MSGPSPKNKNVDIMNEDFYDSDEDLQTAKDRQMKELQAKKEMTDLELDVKLRESIKSLIKRQFHKFQVSKNMNPQSLKNRV